MAPPLAAFWSGGRGYKSRRGRPRTVAFGACQAWLRRRSQLRLPMEAPPRRPKRRTCAGLLTATKRVAKLYLLGLLLSLLSALLGLLGFFGEWLPLSGPELFLPGQPTEQPRERGQRVDGPPQTPTGEAQLGTHKAPSGSCP